MDNLFKEHEKRLLAEKAERERPVARQLIEQYDERIKGNILQLYAEKGTQIARLIAIAKATPTCTDLVELKKLKEAYDALERDCSSYCTNTFKQATLLELWDSWNDQGTRTFPPWEVDVAQEWCDYWQNGMLLGGSARAKGYDYGKPLYTTPQVIKNWTEFKSRQIHVDIWKTVSTGAEWRKRYDLEHLDALSLYTGTSKK